jgi:hypothetical protein
MPSHAALVLAKADAAFDLAVVALAASGRRTRAAATEHVIATSAAFDMAVVALEASGWRTRAAATEHLIATSAALTKASDIRVWELQLHAADVRQGLHGQVRQEEALRECA